MLKTAFLLLSASIAQAHDKWTDGTSIPAWVKSQCCGPEEAHHLSPEQVHRKGNFYAVDGYDKLIPLNMALPSQDGEYWIFYRDNTSPDQRFRSQSPVYCFFVPMFF